MLELEISHKNQTTELMTTLKNVKEKLKEKEVIETIFSTVF